MLIETKCSEGYPFGEGTSIYSLVSETNEFNPHNGESSGGVGKETASTSGLLILDGEEDTSDEEEEEEASKGSEIEPTRLSVPETVLLPSEIGSVAAVSCVTNHDNERREKGVVSLRNTVVKWIEGRLQSYVSRLRTCSGGLSYSVPLFPTLLLVASLLLSVVFMSHSWRNEALHLRAELQNQKALLPLTLSLLKEREALVEKQRLLERGKWGIPKYSHHEDIIHPNEPDDGAFLSFKNCYIEASVSLGLCSKELRNRWSGKNGSDETSDDEDFLYDHDGAFTDDMGRLVKYVSGGLASATAQSYSYLEKGLKYLSYDGIKETFSTNNDIQSIVTEDWGLQ